MRKLAAILALALAGMLPGAALADGTSATATDSLTILSTFTLVGVPTSITYHQRAANFVGKTWIDPSAQTPANNTQPGVGLVHVVQFGGSDGSVRLSLDMTDLVGRQTIAKTARVFYTEALSPTEQGTACPGWNAYTGNPGGSSQGGWANYNPSTNNGKTLAVTTGPSDCAAINVGLGVDIPAGITGDVLTGTVVFNVGP
jgi:hypothetical protein